MPFADLVIVIESWKKSQKLFKLNNNFKMKKTIIFSIITSLFFACNSKPDSHDRHNHEADTAKTEVKIAMPQTDSLHAEHNKTTESSAKSNYDLILIDYLNLKNALVKDDSKAAADAGNAILATLKKFDNSTSKSNKEIIEIFESIKENAEHIKDNNGKIDHQREHFAMISKDMIDLIAISGTSKKLYQDFCPMFNDSKGAAWLSETKGIKNPYYGAEMLTCGSVKKEY